MALAQTLQELLDPHRSGKKFENLTGKKFHRWTVLELAPRTGKIKVHWLCRCECGNVRTVDTHRLRSGGSKSCGCYSRDLTSGNNRKHPGNVARNNLIARIRKDARDRGYSFDLTYEQCEAVFCQPCRYCGVEPQQESKSKYETFVYNGLDRIDNSLGYTESNVAPCCRICNLAKGQMSVLEFRSWVLRVAEKFNA